MVRFQVTHKSLLHFTVVTLLGMVVALGNPLTVDAKERVSKRALQEMIAGAKTAADHKAIADYYYAEAAKAQAKAVEHDEMVPEGWRGSEEDPLLTRDHRSLREAGDELQVHSG